MIGFEKKMLIKDKVNSISCRIKGHKFTDIGDYDLYCEIKTITPDGGINENRDQIDKFLINSRHCLRCGLIEEIDMTTRESQNNKSVGGN